MIGGGKEIEKHMYLFFIGMRELLLFSDSLSSLWQVSDEAGLNESVDE